VIVPELNLGQLCRLVRSEYLVDARAVSKVQGLPFTSLEIEAAIEEAFEDLEHDTLEGEAS
jgi:2-oxoglutarate ferredoxin oxidoreductase subunit alpha